MEELYYKYPSSKFILTVRKNEEEWYNSLLRHSKRSKNSPQRLEVYGHYNPDDNNKLDHIEVYNNHNRNVIDFFKRDPNRFLILNTSDTEKEKKIYKFIDLSYDKNNYIKYPHCNKST